MMKLGIIGGSGIYDIEGLSHVRQEQVTTPFGEPSDHYICGTFGNDVELVFLPRHGRGHYLLPSEINYRANIYGFKTLGVNWLLSVSAVGSMKENIQPGDLVAPDQFFDRTYKRDNTFFGQGIVAHVPFGNPVCDKLQRQVVLAARELGYTIHDGGTYVCIEGPQFSSRAESLFFRGLDVSVIGMTNLPEARLAREAEMSYASLSLATDFDCWHESEASVSADAVLMVMQANVNKAKQVIKQLALGLQSGASPWQGMLRNAIVTKSEFVPAETKKRLSAIIGPYMS